IRMMDIIVKLAASAVFNSTIFAETQESALTDALTNLPNSRYLRQVFEQEKIRSQQAGQPMAFLEADLDSLKAINDRYGHHGGERFEDLLVRADHNLYQNKSARKNTRLERAPNIVPFPIKNPSTGS